MKYAITKENAQSRILPNHVCQQCGGEVAPMETTDNAGNPTYWNACHSCMVLTNGVHISIFKAALKMFEDRFYPSHYAMEYMDSNPEYFKQIQLSRIVDIIRKVMTAMDIENITTS